MNATNLMFEVWGYVYRGCPIDTGNLKHNGIGDVSSMTKAQAEFRINEFDAAPYGIIINEAPVINYFGMYPRTNRNYHWLDKALDRAVASIENKYGGNT